MSVEEVVACSMEGSWLWTHGHVPKRKFKGKAIAEAKSGYFESIEPYDYLSVVRGKVKHGWVLTVKGDSSGCAADFTIYFITEPLAEGTTTYEECLGEDGDFHPCEIYDGPHEATWLEPAL